MSRRLNLKLGLSFNRALRAGPGEPSPSKQTVGMLRTQSEQPAPLSPGDALKRLIADPDNVEVIEFAADTFAKAGRWAHAKAFYAACLENSSDEAIEEKLHEITAGELNTPANRTPWRDDRFVYDPSCGIDSAVIAAIE